MNIDNSKKYIKLSFSSSPISWLSGFLLVFIVVSGTARAQSIEPVQQDVIFQYVDPLIKVFPNSTMFPHNDAHDDVARGQYATLQFVIRSNKRLNDFNVTGSELTFGSNRISGIEIGYVGYVHVSNTARVSAHDRSHPISDYFPDPILENPPATLNPELSQPIWIKISIPPDAVPGLYKGSITLTANVMGDTLKLERSFSVRVYPPVIQKTRLWVTNWWRSGNNRLNYMNDGHPVETYSPKYWELIRSLAHTMALYRQNVALISPLKLAEYKLEDDQYTIDFSHFDQMVEIFIEEGVIGRIEGRHFAYRTSDAWDPNSPFQVYVPRIKKDTVLFEKHDLTDKQAQSFYNQFIPSLVAHLKEKGWSDIYIQHIADEPTKVNADSYIAIAHFFKNLAPNMQFIDAALYQDLHGVLNTWVPTLDGLHDNYQFYKERSEKGDEVWFYTCVIPQGEYANRFIELPLIKTRILHWINFRYNITGYLHWGFNFWDGNPWEEASERGLPGGDSWIVYPKKGGVVPSIRLEAMRDGIVDYELLKMLEEQYPNEAHDLVKKVIHNFDRYNTSVSDFRETHRELLELLSKK